MVWYPKETKRNLKSEEKEVKKQENERSLTQTTKT
jgi:hypothetical protein